MALTTEKNYSLNSNLLVTNEQDENGIRIFIKDKNGIIYFLLFAIPKSICKEDDEKYNFGLFITHFEYAIEIRNLSVFTKALDTFVNYANYAMFQIGKDLVAKYKYVWAQYNINAKCEIAKIFDLVPVNNIGDTIIYKKELDN